MYYYLVVVFGRSNIMLILVPWSERTTKYSIHMDEILFVIKLNLGTYTGTCVYIQDGTYNIMFR